MACILGPQKGLLKVLQRLTQMSTAKKKNRSVYSQSVSESVSPAGRHREGKTESERRSENIFPMNH